MRSILRHINLNLRNKPSGLDVNNTRMWQEYVVSQYRAGAAVKDRETVKQLRTMATDTLANLLAVKDQKVWLGVHHLIRLVIATGFVVRGLLERVRRCRSVVDVVADWDAGFCRAHAAVAGFCL